MPNRTEAPVPPPRRPWVADARSRSLVLERECRRRIRWKSRPSAWGRLLRLAAAGLFLLAAAALDARAAFDGPTASVQASAMGGASLAGRADPASLFLNPAAAAGLVHPEAYLMYDQPYAGLGVGGLGQGFAAFGVPAGRGAFSAGVSDFQASGLLEERIVGVSYARPLFGGIKAGVTGKYLYHDYKISGDALAAADPVFKNGTSRGAFAVDLGLTAPLARNLRLGLAVRNLNQPDVGLSSADRVPREFQAGLSYLIEDWDLRLTADDTYRAQPSGVFQQRNTPGVGLEKGFEHDQVFFRAGATPTQAGAGVGIAVGPMTVDYAFLITYGLVANNAGTHMIGLRYRFGGPARTYTTWSH